MIAYRRCSWCHELNPAAAHTCAECGHQMDVPRLACDCPPCRRMNQRA